MMRSIVLAGLLVAALAACAQKPPPAAAATAAETVPPRFVPYCGSIWSVDKQGYLDIPCPPGSGYASGGQ